MNDDTITLLVPFIDDFGATIVIVLLIWYAVTERKIQAEKSRESNKRIFDSLDKLLTILGKCIDSDDGCG